MLRGRLLAIAVVILAALTGCGPRTPACPETAEVNHHLGQEEFAEALAATPVTLAAPVEVELGRRKIQADKVVSGPLCNDSWRGTVYVTCDARVAEWVNTDAPEFLKGCNLDIESGTVVYVAAHYDAPYYEGCSCHTGEIGGP